jgi:DNA-binding NarL/FixJ family response regulator
MTMTRVVVVDDHALVRAGIRLLLESLDNIEVVGESGECTAVFTLVAQLQPDVVLMDITMPGLNGLDATLQLVKQWPHIRVLMLSMHESEEYVDQALANGAAGYLLKDSAPVELDAAIKTVMAGRVYLSPALAQDLICAHVDSLRVERLAGPALSPRQSEVLQLVAQGKSTKEIARLLGLSVKTVETHRSRLMQQLDVHEVTGLVRYAMRMGLVRHDR